MHETDDRIYRRFLSGDNEIYGELMRIHGDELVRYLHGLLRSWEDAEDLMIEAFARILVKKPSIRAGNFKAYLYKTARNLAARHHRTRKRAEAFRLEDLSDTLAADELTEDRAREAERRRQLYQCLGQIEPELREALYLVYLEDLEYREAAEVLGVSPKRIDKLLQRGKLRLREALEKEGIRDAEL